MVVGLLEQQPADDKRNPRHDHGVVETDINVVRALANMNAYEWYQAIYASTVVVNTLSRKHLLLRHHFRSADLFLLAFAQF